MENKIKIYVIGNLEIEATNSETAKLIYDKKVGKESLATLKEKTLNKLVELKAEIRKLFASNLKQKKYIKTSYGNIYRENIGIIIKENEYGYGDLIARDVVESECYSKNYRFRVEEYKTKIELKITKFDSSYEYYREIKSKVDFVDFLNKFDEFKTTVLESANSMIEKHNNTIKEYVEYNLSKSSKEEVLEAFEQLEDEIKQQQELLDEANKFKQKLLDAARED